MTRAPESAARSARGGCAARRPGRQVGAGAEVLGRDLVGGRETITDIAHDRQEQAPSAVSGSPRWIDGVAGVIRTVLEVAGHTRFKGLPEIGRRSLPLPGWLVAFISEHTEQYGYGEADRRFGNEVGAAHRRTNFRARVWRPSLVRAGLLGAVTREGDRWVGSWTDDEPRSGP